MHRPAKDTDRARYIAAVRSALSTGEWATTQVLLERVAVPMDSVHLCDLRRMGVLVSRKADRGASHWNEWAVSAAVD